MKLDPIDVFAHRDFPVVQIERLCRFLEVAFAEQPAHRGEAVLLDEGALPRRMQRAELVAHLRSSGLGSLARRVERLPTPTGFIAVLVVGDEGPRLHAFDLATFLEGVPVRAEPSAAMSVSAVPAASRVSDGASRLGRFIGGGF